MTLPEPLVLVAHGGTQDGPTGSLPSPLWLRTMDFLGATDRTALRGAQKLWLRLSHYCPVDLSTVSIGDEQTLNDVVVCFHRISGIKIGFFMDEIGAHALVTRTLRPQNLLRVEMAKGCYVGSLLPFAHLSHLHELMIRKNHGFSGTLAGIGSCKRLRSIVIQDCPIRGDLTPLGACQRLEKAFFSGCKKLKGNLNTLSHLPLKWIGFVNTKVVFDEENLEQLKQLEVAWLDRRNMRANREPKSDPPAVDRQEPTCVSEHERGHKKAASRSVFLV